MTVMPPRDAIKLKEVNLVESYPPDDTLPKDGLYCYLLRPGEEHDDQCMKAMDRIWSKKTYRLNEVMEDSGNWVMYYLKHGTGQSLCIRRVDAHSRRHRIASRLHSEMVLSIKVG